MVGGIADTHAVIWYTFSDSRLSSNARSFITSANLNGDHIGVSSITLIEMVYLIEKGRIAAESFTRLVTALEAPQSEFVEIPVDLRTARALSQIDVAQIPDMPDRLIAAPPWCPMCRLSAGMRKSSIPG